MVKFLCLTLLLLAVIQLSTADNEVYFKKNRLRAFHGGMGEKFRGLLERLKMSLKNGDPKLGIPVIEPLNIENYELKVEKGDISIDGKIKNLHVAGLSNYSVYDGDFSLPKKNVSLSLMWSDVDGKTEYDLNAFVGQKLPVYGKGDIHFKIKNLFFATQAKIFINAKTKKVSILYLSNTKIKVEKTKIKVTGLYHDDEISAFISEVLSDMIPDSLVEYQPEITKEINSYLKEAINNYLDRFTLEDIMGLLNIF